jgi:hypothetical protein
VLYFVILFGNIIRDRRAILNPILKQKDVKVWTGFTWLRLTLVDTNAMDSQSSDNLSVATETCSHCEYELNIK